MKDKKLEFIIPVGYVLLYLAFILVVNLVIDQNTQGQSEIYGMIYSIGFFVAHPLYSFLFGLLLIIPIPLLVIAILKNRKDLIIGFSISIAISASLLILIGNL